MASADTGDLLTLLLGGGATATIVALFNGLKSIREGSRSRERDTIADLIQRRKESDDERDKARDERDEAEVRAEIALNQRDYWRNWAGMLEYTILQIDPAKLPPKPLPPNPRPLGMRTPEDFK